MAKPKTYIDIGHGTGESFLWVYWRGRLDIRKTGARTHKKIWGRSCMNWWHGRYCIETKRISIAMPLPRPIFNAPEELINLLVEHFGRDVEIWEFDNPTFKRRGRNDKA